ncbi:hypothetical protein AB0I81_00205 [Nonomuraea sp. NPDC050404]
MASPDSGAESASGHRVALVFTSASSDRMSVDAVVQELDAFLRG